MDQLVGDTVPVRVVKEALHQRYSRRMPREMCRGPIQCPGQRKDSLPIHRNRLSSGHIRQPGRTCMYGMPNRIRATAARPIRLRQMPPRSILQSRRRLLLLAVPGRQVFQQNDGNKIGLRLLGMRRRKTVHSRSFCLRIHKHIMPTGHGSQCLAEGMQ